MNLVITLYSETEEEERKMKKKETGGSGEAVGFLVAGFVKT